MLIRKPVHFCFIIIFLSCSESKNIQDHQNWGYTGNHGPDFWAEIHPDYLACSKGFNQSPINLTNFIDADLPELFIEYGDDGISIQNTGHTIQVDFNRGSFFNFRDHPFELLQLHFHTPSEHLLDGISFPMEMHLVHSDARNQLAVISVLFEVGESNAIIENLLAQIPDYSIDSKNLTFSFSAENLFT